MRVLAGVAVVVSAGCVDTPLEAEDPARVLFRASLDLRGAPPSLEEQDRVAADPSSLPDLLDELVEDPRFAVRIGEIYADVLFTRHQKWPYDGDDVGVPGVSRAALMRAVGEEPIQMFAAIAREDRPITDLVTGGAWTMADPLLAAAFPLSRVDGEGWTAAAYQDGRPGAGVLSTNAMHWRYPTSSTNANRRRAAAFARVFLCRSYETGVVPVGDGEELRTAAAVRLAVREVAACAGCHKTLDPMGSAFFGFPSPTGQLARDVLAYDASESEGWREMTGIPPGYGGSPVGGVQGLGAAMAADPAFHRCAAEHALAAATGRQPDGAEDAAVLDGLDAALVAGDLRFDALYRALPDSEGYGARPPRLKPPSLLASNLKDLLGFQWVDDTGDEALLVGTWSVLAGGADGFVTAHAASSPDPASSLVWAAVAEAAASEAVAQAIAGDVRWFDLATPATPPHLDEAGAQLDQWWRRLTGAPPSAADRAVWEGLLRDVGATDGVAAGWTAVLSAMLRDPDFLTY